MEGSVIYHENLQSVAGNPAFTSGVETELRSGDSHTDSAPYWVDMDNDSDLDLVVGDRDCTITYYQNNAGVLTEVALVLATGPFVCLLYTSPSPRD